MLDLIFIEKLSTFYFKDTVNKTCISPVGHAFSGMLLTRGIMIFETMTAFKLCIFFWQVCAENLHQNIEIDVYILNEFSVLHFQRSVLKF